MMTDKGIIEFAEEFREGILDGRPSTNMCMMVSAPLGRLLEFHGIENRLVEFDVNLPDNTVTNHICIELLGGKFLDPTADQFNYFLIKKMPKVYLGEKPFWYQLNFNSYGRYFLRES